MFSNLYNLRFLPQKIAHHINQTIQTWILKSLRVVMPVPEMLKSNLLNRETRLSIVDTSSLRSEIINYQNGLVRESKSNNFFGDLSQDMLDYFEPVSNTS